MIEIRSNICKGVCPCCEILDGEHLPGCYYEACADCGKNHGKNGCQEAALEEEWLIKEALAKEELENDRYQMEAMSYGLGMSTLGWDGNG